MWPDPGRDDPNSRGAGATRGHTDLGMDPAMALAISMPLGRSNRLVANIWIARWVRSYMRIRTLMVCS